MECFDLIKTCVSLPVIQEESCYIDFETLIVIQVNEILFFDFDLEPGHSGRTARQANQARATG